ncbi:MAG: hypothetical protein ACREGI_01725, partial [Candidatus Levyibacteriota bacterium]
IMEFAIDAPHKINFLSRSEIIFDVIRKAIESVSISDYVDWLQQQRKQGNVFGKPDQFDKLIEEAKLWKEDKHQEREDAELVVSVGRRPVYYPAREGWDNVQRFSLHHYKQASHMARAIKLLALPEEKSEMFGKVDEHDGLLRDVMAILLAINSNVNVAENEYRKLLEEIFGHSSRREERN